MCVISAPFVTVDFSEPLFYPIPSKYLIVALHYIIGTQLRFLECYKFRKDFVRKFVECNDGTYLNSDWSGNKIVLQLSGCVMLFNTARRLHKKV